MTEVEYRGWRIVEVDTDIEAFGFRMTRAFAVKDEFDDGLPMSHQMYWSPGDARQAIDFVIDVFKLSRKWLTTHTHEFNIAMCYRARFVEVYAAILKVKNIIDDAREMGDDPSRDILDHLQALNLRCLNQHAK